MVVECKEPLVYDVPTAGKLLNLSRATAYTLANQGIIPTIRFGRRMVVPRKALEELLASVGKAKEGWNYDGNDKFKPTE